MIGKTRSVGWLVRSLVIGGTLGAFALSPAPSWAEDEASDTGAPLVARDAAEPAADAALRAKLAGPAADGVARRATLEDLAVAYSAALGAGVRVTDAARERAGDRAVSLPAASGLTAAQHLDFALWQLDLQIAVKDGELVIGGGDEVVGTIERRVYDVRPVVDAFAKRAGGADGDGPALHDEHLIALVQGCVRSYQAWMGDGISISTVDGGVAVSQTAEVHADVEAFLRRLAHYGAPVSDAANERLESQLAKRVSIEADETPLRDVALRIEEHTGAPVVVDFDCADTPISLVLADLPAENVASLAARSAKVHTSMQNGVLIFSKTPPTETRMYSVNRALGPNSERVLLDHVVELSTSLEPWSWATIGSAEGMPPDLLIVKNTPSVHTKLAGMLSALGRIGTGPAGASPIPVVAETPETAADLDVRSKLGTAATWAPGEVAMSGFGAAVREAYGINVVADGAVSGDDVAIGVPAPNGLTVRQQLSRAVRGVGLDVGVRDGVLVLGRTHSMVDAGERRYYDLQPVLDAHAARARAAAESHADGEPGSRHASMGEEDIIALVQNCVGPQDLWTYAGVSLACGRGWLVAVHTHEVHGRMQHMLERLLDYEGHPEGVIADPATNVRFYDVGNVLDTARGTHAARELMDRILAVSPASWEGSAWAEIVVPDLLVVKNDTEAHAQLAKVIAELSAD